MEITKVKQIKFDEWEFQMGGHRYVYLVDIKTKSTEVFHLDPQLYGGWAINQYMPLGTDMIKGIQEFMVVVARR